MNGEVWEIDDIHNMPQCSQWMVGVMLLEELPMKTKRKCLKSLCLHWITGDIIFTSSGVSKFEPLGQVSR